VLGASNYTYAEATRTQQVPDWIASHTRACAFFGGVTRRSVRPAQERRPRPDCAWIHTERRKAGVTLELLHLEYLEQHPDGYRYTRFCDPWPRAPGVGPPPGPLSARLQGLHPNRRRARIL
jgi:transposase